MKDFINKLTYSTVKIESTENDFWGNEIGKETGTGFFYKITGINNKKYYFVITNKHIVRMANFIDITMPKFYIPPRLGALQLHIPKIHLDNNKHVFLNLDRIWKDPTKLIYHPDQHVDLCAIRIQDNLLNLELNIFPLSKELLINSEEDFSVLEQVIMIGYPCGLCDTSNCRPLIKCGVTATPIALDYDGGKDFVIDVSGACGSSGSPVFVLNKGEFIRDKSKRKVYLAGVCYAMPNCFELEQKGRRETISRKLVCVIKASRIKELEEEIRKIYKNQ